VREQALAGGMPVEPVESSALHLPAMEPAEPTRRQGDSHSPVTTYCTLALGAIHTALAEDRLMARRGRAAVERGRWRVLRRSQSAGANDRKARRRKDVGMHGSLKMVMATGQTPT